MGSATSNSVHFGRFYHPHPAILSSTNKHTMDRYELQEKYIQWDLEQMTADDLVQFFIDTQMRELSDLDDDELIEDVKQYAPELL